MDPQLHLHVDESYDAGEKVDVHAREKNAAEHDEKKKGVVANAAVAAGVGYCYFHDDTHHHLERRRRRVHCFGNEWYHMEGQICRVVVAF